MIGILVLLLSVYDADGQFKRHKMVQTNDPSLSYFPLKSGSGLEVQAARQLLLSTPCYPEILYVNNMTNAQLKALHIMDNNYVTQHLMIEHAKWHSNPKNSIGGNKGFGTGIPFCGMHAMMMKNYERWVNAGSSKNWRRPGWNPRDPIPDQLFIDPKFAPLGARKTNDPKYEEPIMLYETDPYTGLSANDFLSPEDWCRYVGLSLHNSPHFLISGPMNNSAISPTDWSAFANWHIEIQHAFERYLQSFYGSKWAREHPTHLLLTSNNINDFANSDKFMNDGICTIGNPLQICRYLQQRQEFVDG